MKIKVSKTDNQTTIIYYGDAKWNETSIHYDGTYIQYSTKELVIRRKKELSLHLVFVENEESVHTVGTEYGVIKLKAYTSKISIKENFIVVEYSVENKKNTLVIEEVK